VSLYRDDAVVLRVQKLGEADRIITLLTRRHGRVRAVGKGVRRTTSRFGARLEPFSHVDVQLYTGRSLDIVTQAESIAAYGAELVGDYARYTAGTAVLETAERLTAEECEPSLRLYLLVVGALRSLAAGEHDPPLVLDAFLVRAMAVAGWEPALAACAQCGLPGPHRSFSVPAGGAVCPACRPPGAARPAAGTLTLLTALLAGDWRTADGSEDAARREASGLLAAHLQWHLERGLRSLPLVERSPAGPIGANLPPPIKLPPGSPSAPEIVLAMRDEDDR
jgi:DNA repair protein RecO (recombination protein O)